MSLTRLARRSIVTAVELAARVQVPARLDRDLATLGCVTVGAYRLTASRWLGRQCLFSPTCSARALASFGSLGWNAGIVEIRAQLARCGGNYMIRLSDGGDLEMVACDGAVVPGSQLAPQLRERYAPAAVAGPQPCHTS